MASAVEILSKKKIGAIIAIERADRLKTYAESGIVLDCKVSSELIQTIFTPAAPIHDGGIIIQGDRIAAAVCLFPLTENPNIAKTVGTRHRSAVGLTELSDAIVIVVSEETGNISFVLHGRLHSVNEKVDLVRLLKNNLIKQPKIKQ